MSKKEKLLKDLTGVPAPLDFRWDKLVTLLRACGFIESCDGGSHYTFEHTSGFKFGVSKTHPSGILKRYQVRDAIDALKKVGEV